MARQRVLLAILVYNGRAFVPACLHSAAGARVGHRDVDVLVLDDCSPEEGWSEEVRGICESLGFGYYRSPRNLGIPRNMNLALARAQSRAYDYVFIVNSDVVMPLNMVNTMIRVAESHAGIGSVTAWSNSASTFSLPNHDDTGTLSHQDTVDWISAELERTFGPVALDVPTGVGFCMLIPVPVVDQVGLFDPVYGRGYCEEVDWCLRSRARGYRAVLSASTFVFHEGSASTVNAGMLARTQTTVAEHEHIVDLRYPWYRADIAAFLDSGALPLFTDRAVRAILVGAAARLGYEVEATGIPTPPVGDRVRVVVDPEGAAPVQVQYCGFTLTLDVDGGDPVAAIRRFIASPPVRITLFDRGAHSDQLVAAWGGSVPVTNRYTYPQRV